MSKPQSRPRQLAAQCLVEAKGDRERATRALRKLADADPALWKELTADAIDGILWELVRYAAQQHREAAWKQVGGETEPKFSVYFYPLPNGTPLGQATREDLQAAIDLRARDFTAAKRDIAWYGSILRRLQGKQTVEQVLSEEELKRMQERALNGAKVKAA